MSLGLPEDPVDPEDMVQHLVEQDQGHVQLLLIKDLVDLTKQWVTSKNI